MTSTLAARLAAMFTEPSTWRGLAVLFGVVGLQFTNVDPADILALALAVIGAIEILRTEKPEAEFTRIVTMFTEPSTWRGLAAVGGAVGLQVSPLGSTDVLSLMMTVMAAIEMIRKERNGGHDSTAG